MFILKLLFSLIIGFIIIAILVYFILPNFNSGSHPSPSPSPSPPTPPPSPPSPGPPSPGPPTPGPPTPGPPTPGPPTPGPPTPGPPTPGPSPQNIPVLYGNSNPGVLISMLENPIFSGSGGGTITVDTISKLGHISNNKDVIALSLLNQKLPLNIYAASTSNIEDIINIGTIFDPDKLKQFLGCLWVTDSGSDKRSCSNSSPSCSCQQATPAQIQTCNNTIAGKVNCNTKCNVNDSTCATVKWCSGDGITSASDFADKYRNDNGTEMCTFKPENIKLFIESAIAWRKAYGSSPEYRFRETELDALVPNTTDNQNLINDSIIGFIVSDLCNANYPSGICDSNVMTTTINQMKQAVGNFNTQNNKNIKLYKMEGLSRAKYNGTPTHTWEENNYKSEWSSWAKEISL